jgi:BR serine/threonine kinase
MKFLGNIRRFRRICEHIQAQVCSKRYPTVHSPINQKPINQIPAPVSTSSNSAVSSESISCGSNDSSDRINYNNNRQNDSEAEVETFFDCNTTTVKPRRSSASSNKNGDDGSAPHSPSIKTVSSR